VDQPTTPTLSAAPPEVVAVTGAAVVRVREPWRRRFWRTYVSDVRRDTNARASVTRATDLRAALVFVTAAVALTCNNFLSDGGHPQWLETVLRGVGMSGLATRVDNAMMISDHREWNQLAFWAIVVISCYVIPPVLLIKLVFRERVRDYGVRVRGILPHLREYAVLYAIAAPLIVLASFTPAFQERYPFYHPVAAHSLWPYMYLWWGLYALQFCALEFFFRGFLLNGLVPRLGWAAIFAMALSYNMLHYGKPMPEALAAIVGAIVLGTLSLKTRSIWWGAVLHIAIALTMDMCALGHMGRVF